MVCEICGFDGKSLVSHITRKHNISVIEYKKRYNVKSVHCVSDEQRLHLSLLWAERKKDPYWVKKMGENKKSIWSVDYWVSEGYSKDEATTKVSKYQSSNSKKRDYDKSPGVLSMNYYINKGIGVEEATLRISEMQSKLSKASNKFKGKFHSDTSKERIGNTMSEYIHNIGSIEWAKHFGEFSDSKFRSKGEIELFNMVSTIVSGNLSANEFICGYNVDILCGNKIVDYFGSYWHCNPQMYNADYFHIQKNKSAYDIWKYDELRGAVLCENGYELLVVWDTDFNKGIEYVENKIKRFLYDT
jgi:hypothetical protein